MATFNPREKVEKLFNPATFNIAKVAETLTIIGSKFLRTIRVLNKTWLHQKQKMKNVKEGRMGFQLHLFD